MKKCPTCSRKKKSPLLTENKIQHLLSEELKYHIEYSIPLNESLNILNYGEYSDLIKEARKLYSRGVLNLNEIDTSIIKSQFGNKSTYNNKEIPLDTPISGDNPIDTIMMDVPLFMRMLEYAKEDAKTDMDLHHVTEKAIALSTNGEILNMDNYDEIVGKELKESYNFYHRNPNTKQIQKFNFKIYEQKIDVSRLRKIINEVLTK